MANSSPLSYQTTMPEYPDVSYEGYINHYYPQGVGATSRVGNWFDSTFGHIPSWNEWRTTEIDKYNAQMSAYNTWLQSGAGKRASAESGNYNPSYFDVGSSGASPLDYSQISPSSPFTDMAQGVAGIFQFIQALQGMKMMSAQIAGQEAKNKAQNIINSNLAEQLKWKNLGLFNNAHFLGYRADDQAFKTASNLYSVYGIHKDIAANEQFSPFGIMSYNLKDFKDSPIYQRAWADISLIRASKQLRDIQKEMFGWNVKERKFYVNSIQKVYKAFLDNQLALARGELNFQPIAQKLRKQATQWGIGVNVANTAINAAKTVVGMLTPAGAAANALPGVPSWGNLPNQSQSWGSGWDAMTGEWINPYNGYQ